MMMLAAEKTDVCGETKNRLIDFILISDYTRFMPVTKTAKRALRSSGRKALINKNIISRLEIAVRQAKKTASKANILKAVSLTDRAAKKHTIHPNKAARIKSTLTKLRKRK